MSVERILLEAGKTTTARWSTCSWLDYSGPWSSSCWNAIDYWLCRDDRYNLLSLIAITTVPRCFNFTQSFSWKLADELQTTIVSFCSTFVLIVVIGACNFDHRHSMVVQYFKLYFKLQYLNIWKISLPNFLISSFARIIFGTLWCSHFSFWTA